MRKNGTLVTFAGTGGGIASDKRSIERGGPAVVVEFGDIALLFDAGRNVLWNLLRFDIDPANLARILFTHHHSDHIIGLPDLVLSTWVASSRNHWEVSGPAGTRDLFDRLFGEKGAFRPDIEARAFGSSSRRLFKERIGKQLELPAFNVQEIGAEGRVHEGEEWQIDASFAPDHVQPALISVAYRVTTPSGTVVISGDTGPNDAMAEFAHGADLLIHDCTLLERKGVYLEQQVHTDAASLGRIAAQAGVKAVVGTHITRGIDRDAILGQFPERVAHAFDGDFRVAADGLQVEMEPGEVRFLSHPNMSGIN